MPITSRSGLSPFPSKESESIDLTLSQIERSYVFPLEATTWEYACRNMNWRGRRAFLLKARKNTALLNEFYESALRQKACYYGPFKGEFGHFLLHNLPFLMHLHKQGVAIHYCGMSLHKPFLVDEDGNDIIAKWYPLRDFFAQVHPKSNETKAPADIQIVIDAFRSEALSTGLPYLDIENQGLYWWVFRNWQLEGKQHVYPLQQAYAKTAGRSCVIFPRKKGGSFTANNGGPWDYIEIAKALAPHFEEVKLVGHPSLSADVEAQGNIRICVSADNAKTLRHCAEASLIITQHSGAVHLGAYVNTPVLIIFNGMPPIKGLIDTLRFRKNISKDALSYAFNLNEIVNFAAAQKH
jgi:hypothetical protein